VEYVFASAPFAHDINILLESLNNNKAKQNKKTTPKKDFGVKMLDNFSIIYYVI
jgi:hypothetical protein